LEEGEGRGRRARVDGEYDGKTVLEAQPRARYVAETLLRMVKIRGHDEAME
jgi:hypothetical protein